MLSSRNGSMIIQIQLIGQIFIRFKIRIRFLRPVDMTKALTFILMIGFFGIVQPRGTMASILKPRLRLTTMSPIVMTISMQNVYSYTCTCICLYVCMCAHAHGLEMQEAYFCTMCRGEVNIFTPILYVYLNFCVCSACADNDGFLLVKDNLSSKTSSVGYFPTDTSRPVLTWS